MQSYEKNITFHSSLFTFHFFFITFAADMQISDKMVNIVLAVLAAGLLVACIASVMAALK
jgi:hypothetical protein